MWFLLAGAPVAAWAQTPASADTGSAVIHSVEIVRHNVFDSTQTRAFYARLMNAVHIITRDGVVRNEVLQKPGKPYDPKLAAETARNLRKLNVFEKIDLDTIRTDSGLTLRVTTQDAWSTKPAVNFKSTGGQISWAAAFLEDNLLGTNTHLFAKYAVDPDRTTLGFALLKQRLIARRLSLLLNYQDLSDGQTFLSQFGLPYLSLSAHEQAMLSVQSGDVRILEYRDGITAVAHDSVGRRYAIIRGDFGWAPRADPAGYLRLGLTAIAREDDTTLYASGLPFSQSWFGAVTGTAEWRRAHYTVLHGFSGMSRDEDIDLSTTVSVGLALAPSAWGYASNSAGPVLTLHSGLGLGHGFAYLDARANGLYSSAGPDSGTALASTTIVFPTNARSLFVLHAEGGWKHLPAPGDQFDLGLGIGPRAYPLHAFTGDREAFFTAEYRVAAVHNLWGLFDLGVAGSVDRGGAWYAGSPSRWGTDVGVGLRLGSVRAARPDATRFDLSWRFANDVMQGGWVFSVGRGFAFALPPVQ